MSSDRRIVQLRWLWQCNKFSVWYNDVWNKIQVSIMLCNCPENAVAVTNCIATFFIQTDHLADELQLIAVSVHRRHLCWTAEVHAEMCILARVQILRNISQLTYDILHAFMQQRILHVGCLLLGDLSCTVTLNTYCTKLNATKWVKQTQSFSIASWKVQVTGNSV